MSPVDRHSTIMQAIAERDGRVPPCRSMMRLLASRGFAVSAKTVALDYRRLGLRSNSARGRKPAETAMIQVRVPVAVFDIYDRAARRRRDSVAGIAATVLGIGARSIAAKVTISDGHKSDQLTDKAS